MKMPIEHIREEICKAGVIPFKRFMELALYCPETGYYESQKDIVGRSGDFITNVSTGSLFGELLAFQFAAWLGEMETSGGKLTILEAGAHDGKLAGDVLNWLRQHRPELNIEYCLLEPSTRRQEWQKEKLKAHANVRWCSELDEPIRGIIFSNELLDAFPVHRLGWNALEKTWFEWGVMLTGEKLTWAPLPLTTLPADVCQLPASLLNVLPDGYTIETSPAAENWWHRATSVLTQGKLLTIDYGFTMAEQFSPSRTRGTLRAYHRHRVSDDLLANPGEQDLTAHVNFSAIQKVGEAGGLHTTQLCSQPQFLTHILSLALKEPHFAKLDAKQVRQFQTLTHPEHLGRAFRVLEQSR